ncbi:hypothetical protein PF005_g10271 [Phytophthora fragariae]|uniref:Uncharacterized protein n=1 Tax=Phytophthora fragariae TaxID=53985 RepID=A0A6A3ZU21_9STRA|nr:hypothetical protein PF003_g25703 [Phytophthora fragariae]KAE8941421.1 hypothetical protein PF009_g8786 [Phytophthora fragariae]KAE9011948.1 hypothetical protein PF011_g9141 [Phytophthora fragariae]KAE9119331.1 hypothetical protein PF007_g8587 [Phytophthora fragariae]KAE9124367.1 hypothetical protein PF010_g6032 [Phytophthora fragariae]
MSDSREDMLTKFKIFLEQEDNRARPVDRQPLLASL